MVGMPQSTALMTRTPEVTFADPVEAPPPSRLPGAALVDRPVQVRQRVAPTLLRLALAVVFV